MEIPNETQQLMDEFKAQRERHKITTLAQAKAELKQWGQQWRDEHTHVKGKGDNERVVIPPVSPREITYKLAETLNFAVLGSSPEEKDKAPLVMYNLDEGIYQSYTRLMEQLILAIEDRTSQRSRKEILNWLRIEAAAKQVIKSRDLVAVGNGVVDTSTNELKPYSPNLVFTSKVATEFHPEVEEPTFNGWKFSEWIEELAGGDPDKSTLIWQMIACVVRPNCTSNVMFLMVDTHGQGRTGKSTLEQLLENLVGDGNFASLKLEEFDNDFLLAQAFGHGLIIGDDNQPKGYIDNGSKLKSIVTNDIVLVNPKGISPFTTRFYCTIVQSMNGMPRFKDTTGGLYRRFRIIQFNKQYEDTPANRKIKDEYINDPQLLQWILKQALTINIDTIIETKESQEMVHETQLDNDAVAYFVENYFDEFQSTRLPVKFLFQFFLAAMEAENSKQALKQNTFTKQLKPILEAKGWHYSRNNLKPGEQFKEDDLNLINQFDKGIGTARGYLAKVESNKKQPLFELLP